MKGRTHKVDKKAFDGNFKVSRKVPASWEHGPMPKDFYDKVDKLKKYINKTTTMKV
tara:strand:+ start:302 stop:469 length:168 start_codon:yes stop_codon:yes gene_type:complete